VPDDRVAVLHRAWTSLPDIEAARRVLAGTKVPGPVALRSRWHLMTDPGFRPAPGEVFADSLDLWRHQVRLETEGDEAVVRNERDVAVAAFEELLTTELHTRHRFVTVNGLVGLADAVRQADDAETAHAHLDEAIRIAVEDGYAFGRLRATVSLAYVILARHSWADARGLFEVALGLAESMDERLYGANSLLGLAEVDHRRREYGDAETHGRRALAAFRGLSSDLGVANAAQRLSDTLIARGRTEDALPFLGEASAAFSALGNHLGVSNTEAALGDRQLERGSPHEAAVHFRASLDAARHGPYPQGRANALAGLAKCALAGRDHELAERLFGEARVDYTALGDLPGIAAATRGLATVAEQRGDRAAAVRARLDIVATVERMRAAHTRPDLQEEYRTRFATAYRDALRTVVDAGDIDAFVLVFEGLAGRRLAGLLGNVAVDASSARFVASLMVSADRRIRGRMRQAPPLPVGDESPDASPGERRRRIVRELGATALRAGLPEVVASEIDTIAAQTYRPLSEQHARALLRELPDGQSLFAVTQVPGTTDIAWLWRPQGGEPRLGRHSLSEPSAALVDRMAHEGLSGSDRLATLAPLGELLPAGVAAGLSSGHRLAVVPALDLWSVPWPAVSLPTVAEGIEPLGASVQLVVAPSLTLHVEVSRRSVVPPRRPMAVSTWRSPDVREFRLTLFDGPSWDHRAESDPGRAIEELRAPDVDLVVWVGHGRPVDGITHYFELNPQAAVTPVDVLELQPPPMLALIACWGAAVPGRGTSDPLTLATVAVARGARQVAATTCEIGDSGPATHLVSSFLHRLPEQDMAQALREATRSFLAVKEFRDASVIHWAPLVVIGAHPSEGSYSA
jgi:tetratricopeptide (TPR) repeat protein